MSELATRWSELVLADLPRSETATRAARGSGSLLRAPSPEEQVVAVERRIGRDLPPSYREFLLISDGAYGDLYGARTADEDGWEVASPESAVVGVGFLPVADLAWLRDVEPRAAEMWRETGPAAPTTVDRAEVHPWGPVADGMRIGVDHRPGTTVLVPFDGLVEWQVWNVHFDTAVAYVSFRTMLEREVLVLEPVTTVDEVRGLIAGVEQGDYLAMQRLGRTTTPEAVPLLVSVANSRSAASGPAMGALGRIGTREAVDELVRLNPHGLADLLALSGSEYACDLLVAGGYFHALATLGDPRAAQLAARRLDDGSLMPGERFIAAWVIGRSGDQVLAAALGPLLDSDPQVAVHAARALARLDLAEGRRRLEELVSDPGAGDSARRSLARLDAGRLP